MPTSDDVRSELTDILVSVVGCTADDVDDQTRLKSLGVDSLSVVEVADELGRRFGVYIADETVNGLVTVGDAVAAVVHHDGRQPPRSTTYAPGPAAAAGSDGAGAPAPTTRLSADPERQKALRRIAGWFAIIGAAVGVVLGIGFTGLVGATGLGSADLPPLTQPSTAAPVTPSPTAAADSTPDPDETADPDPTLVISDTEVSPGQRFGLEGRFPTLKGGDVLQVQVRDKGEEWDDFPITTEVRDGETYRTEIYTSRTGQRDFRVVQKDGDLKTPAVTVQIG